MLVPFCSVLIKIIIGPTVRCVVLNARHDCYYRLENLEEDLISKKVRLLVVDSVASLVRKEFDSRAGKSLIERTNVLTRQAAILKYIAEEFDIPVGCHGYS